MQQYIITKLEKLINAYQDLHGVTNDFAEKFKLQASEIISLLNSNELDYKSKSFRKKVTSLQTFILKEEKKNPDSRHPVAWKTDREATLQDLIRRSESEELMNNINNES